MNLDGGLPTPGQLAKSLLNGIFWTIGGILLLVVLSSGLQWTLAGVGVLLMIFHHVYSGFALVLIAVIGGMFRRVRLF